MKFFILNVFLTFTSCALGIQILNDGNSKYCFQFTWPGALIDDANKVNCSTLEMTGTPCIKPIEITNSGTLPNLTDIWLYKNENNSHTCVLTKGYSCIKYTYKFDDAITNITYFCGKMIENKETAIQGGCFIQKMGGYDVEACACQSTGFKNGMPCNSSTKLTYSFMGLVLVLLLWST